MTAQVVYNEMGKISYPIIIVLGGNTIDMIEMTPLMQLAPAVRSINCFVFLLQQNVCRSMHQLSAGHTVDARTL